MLNLGSKVTQIKEMKGAGPSTRGSQVGEVVGWGTRRNLYVVAWPSVFPGSKPVLDIHASYELKKVP